MGGAPTIEWLRPGVGYAPAAAASMRRLESALGRQHDCNSSYRDYAKQESMWKAWEAWVAGRGPKPPHSRAIAPWLSKHCMGLADDSDDWMTPGYIALAAEHGWIRTAANDPTERHHFEYQEWRDQHINDPVPATPITEQSEEDDMPKNTGITYKSPEKAPAAQQRHVILIHNTDSGFEFEIDNGVGGGPFDGSFTNKLARAYDTPDWVELTEGAAINIKKGLAEVRASHR